MEIIRLAMRRLKLSGYYGKKVGLFFETNAQDRIIVSGKMLGVTFKSGKEGGVQFKNGIDRFI